MAWNSCTFKKKKFEMAWSGCKRFEIASNVRKWQEMAGNGVDNENEKYDDDNDGESSGMAFWQFWLSLVLNSTLQ